MATARTDAAFVLHHVNAFEDEETLVIDMVAYPDSSIIDELYLARLRAGTPINATFAIITVPSNELVKQIHNRMPGILV